MARSEFERIARLSAIFGSPPLPDLGIGDDCALIHPGGPLLATVDAAVEGVHFRRDFLSLEDVSSRAIEAAASDIAAMGADLSGPGCGLLLGWTLPRDLDDDDLDALARGARRAADRLATHVIGGNLASAPLLTLTTTAIARAPSRPLARGGAAVGDVVAVSGPLGAAAVGLQALLAGRGDDPRFGAFVDRWRHPRARVDAGREIGARARAAIDVSDGLAQDAGHVARASGCGIALRPEKLPMLEGQVECAAALGFDALSLALTGGEDYELLATGPADAFGGGWTVVGEVIAGDRVLLVEAAGTRELSATGWDHFRR